MTDHLEKKPNESNPFDIPIDRSGTASVKYDALTAVFGRQDVIPLWVADMDFAVPDCVQAALLKRADHPIYGYTVYPPAFYAAITDWLNHRHDWSVPEEAVVAVPGVVPTMNLMVAALTAPGDGILVQTPVYPPIHQLAGNQGRVALENALIWTEQGYEIDWADFTAKAALARLFVLCSPHNPVGRAWREDELRRMAEICRLHNVLILVDEIHADLVYSPHRHLPLARLSPEISAQCLTLHAPSKTFNVAGLSTSFAVIENPDLRQQFKDALRRSGLTSGNVFGITALIAAYTQGAPWLDQLLIQLRKNRDYVIDYIHREIPEIHVTSPEATFLVWLDCRALGLSDTELNQFFIDEAGLGLNPGPSFGAPGRGFMRMNIGSPLMLLRTALEALRDAVRRLPPR